MAAYRVELAESAADAYRILDLFERQQLFDLFDEFRQGRNLEGDYSEPLSTGQLLQVTIVSRSAVSFVVDRNDRLVRVLVIGNADG